MQSIRSPKFSKYTCKQEENILRTRMDTRTLLIQFVITLFYQRNFHCADLNVRLIGGLSSLEGRVEVYVNGTWGTVCDDSWDTRDAIVVCRQLGHPTQASEAVQCAAFGEGTGQIFLNKVMCVGTEAALEDCPFSSANNCSHNEDAGVRCSDKCTNNTLRLVGGDSCQEGRVEVCVNGIWGTVCDDSWDRFDATVVCRQLGLPLQAAEAIQSRQFGSGEGPITLKVLMCSGNETKLVSCRFQECHHPGGAGVICQDSCSNGDVRLDGGDFYNAGRVIVCVNGTWGRVCDGSWDVRDAQVVCRQLGLPVGGFMVGIRDGQGLGDVVLNDVKCSGAETSLLSCPAGQISDCRNDATVVCLDCTNGDVRLIGGNSFNEGIIEVCINGDWVTICDNTWDTKDAIVACRQLNLPTKAAKAIQCSGLYQGFQPVPVKQNLFDNVNCDGDESTLQMCQPIRVGSCGTSGYAGVRCEDICPDNALRLVGGESCTEGRVEVCINGTWGTVCNSSWDARDAMVVCRQLNFTMKDAVIGHFGQGTGKIFFSNVMCHGDEDSLESCQTSRIHECSHAQDAGVFCNSVFNPTSQSPTLYVVIVIALIVILLFVVVPVVLIYTVKRYGKKKNIIELQFDSMENSSLDNQLSHQHRQASLVDKKSLIIESSNLKLDNIIGQGEFGLVYEARLINKEPSEVVAVKTLKGFVEEQLVKDLLKECSKMQKFDHPHVLKLIGVCLDGGPAPFLIMPFMTNGSLLSHLRKNRLTLCPENNCITNHDNTIDVQKKLLNMCLQVARGMEYLASKKVIHRDLAARNCMIDTNFVIKISDFGLSVSIEYSKVYFRQNETDVIKLPIKWLAPESITDGIFSEKSDVWSYGVTCWEIFSGGMTPYPGIHPLELCKKLINGHRMEKPLNPACTKEIYSLMISCWETNPNLRPYFSELVASTSSYLTITAEYLDFALNDTGNGDSDEDLSPSSGSCGYRRASVAI